jgi:predicted porin
MKRKALAVAVGALFIAPAAQAQITFGNDTIGTVQFYGKLYPQYGVAASDGSTQPGTSGVSTLVSGTSGVMPASTVSPAGSSTPSSTAGVALGQSGVDTGTRSAIDSQNTYLGFRGERGLGPTGLKGIWQVEQSVNLDTGTGTFSNRNSFVGLSHGKFGTVKLGNMDTIYKEYGDPFQMFGISSGNFTSASNMLSHIGIGNNNAARFHERRANSIQYTTATFAGFEAGVQYGPDEAKGNVGNTTNANLWSYGIKWDSQKWYFSVHQEVHNDFFGASNNIPIASLRNGTTDQRTGAFVADASAHSRDTGTRFSTEWRYIENQRVTFDISRLKYNETSALTTGNRFREYRHNTWAIGWDAGFGGPWRFAAQYIRAGAGSCTIVGANCTTDGLNSWTLNGGVRYRFDRQTFVYVIASKLNNGPAARYDNWANADPERGADILQWALGVSYSF